MTSLEENLEYSKGLFIFIFGAIFFSIGYYLNYQYFDEILMALGIVIAVVGLVFGSAMEPGKTNVKDIGPMP